MAKFEVGDEVFTLFHGNGKVVEVEEGRQYPICVSFMQKKTAWFSKEGKQFVDHVSPSLFHKGVQIIEAPEPVRKPPEPQFKTFDKVLVRDSEGREWLPAFFGNYTKDSSLLHCTIATGLWIFCIPYEGNEHLTYTTDSPEISHE